MRRRAGTGGGERVLARVLLRQRDQVGDGLHRQVEPHHQHIGHRPQHGDGGEVLVHVEGELAVERRRDRLRGHGIEADGVAVGCGAGDRLAADIAAGAGLVLDDELLPGHLRELGADDARERVGRPARREDVDVAHRLVGPVALGAGEARGEERAGQGRSQRGGAECQRAAARQNRFGHCGRASLWRCWLGGIVGRCSCPGKPSPYRAGKSPVSHVASHDLLTLVRNLGGPFHMGFWRFFSVFSHPPPGGDFYRLSAPAALRRQRGVTLCRPLHRFPKLPTLVGSLRYRWHKGFRQNFPLSHHHPRIVGQAHL